MKILLVVFCLKQGEGLKVGTILIPTLYCISLTRIVVTLRRPYIPPDSGGLTPCILPPTPVFVGTNVKYIRSEVSIFWRSLSKIRRFGDFGDFAVSLKIIFYFSINKLATNFTTIDWHLIINCQSIVNQLSEIDNQFSNNCQSTFKKLQARWENLAAGLISPTHKVRKSPQIEN